MLGLLRLPLARAQVWPAWVTSTWPIAVATPATVASSPVR